MPRSFTVTFTHNNHSYLAVVAQLQNSVSVFIPDESLHSVIPHGRFSYDAQQGLNIDTFSRSPAQTLMLDVLAAVELHTQVQQHADNL